MLDRRNFLTVSASALVVTATATAASPAIQRSDASAALRALEVGQARLGVCFLDTITGEVTGNRMEEHFAMCSTFKLPLIAAVLREVDQGRLDLAEVLPYSQADLLPWAPVTSQHVQKGGLSIAILAQAAQELSDGVAAGNGSAGPADHDWQPAAASLTTNTPAVDGEHYFRSPTSTGRVAPGLAFGKQNRHGSRRGNHKQVQRRCDHVPAQPEPDDHCRILRQRRVHRPGRGPSRGGRRGSGHDSCHVGHALTTSTSGCHHNCRTSPEQAWL